jgi:hypothetical protein
LKNGIYPNGIFQSSLKFCKYRRAIAKTSFSRDFFRSQTHVFKGNPATFSVFDRIEPLWLVRQGFGRQAFRFYWQWIPSVQKNAAHQKKCAGTFLAKTAQFRKKPCRALSATLNHSR